MQGYVISNQEQITSWLSSFGSFVILVFILLQALTVIIAPLGGFFLVVTMIALFGPALALTLAYLVVTPCYLLNFYLARRYGRPLVNKIIGKTTISKIDHIVKDAGTSTLVVLRVFQGGNFDYLAYGLGLTSIPFKTFAIVNFVAGIPGSVLAYLVISRFNSLVYGILAYYLVAVVLTSISVYWNIYILKKKKIIL